MDIVIHRFIRDGKYYQIKMHLPVLKELESITDPTEKARILALIEKAVQKLPLFSTLPPGSTQTDIQNSLARLPAAEAKKIRATLLSTATQTVKTYQAQFFKATPHAPSVAAAARVKEASSASPVSPPSPPRGGGAAAAAGIGIARDRPASPLAPSTAYAGAAVAGPVSFSAAPPALSFESTIPEYTHLLETWRARYTQALPNTASMQDKIEALSAALDKISSPTDREEIFNQMASDFMTYLKKPRALLEMIPSNWGHILELFHYIHPDRPKDAFEMLAVLHPLLKKTPEFLRNLDVFIASFDGVDKLLTATCAPILQIMQAEELAYCESTSSYPGKSDDLGMLRYCRPNPRNIGFSCWEFYLRLKESLQTDVLKRLDTSLPFDPEAPILKVADRPWTLLSRDTSDKFFTDGETLLKKDEPYKSLIAELSKVPCDLNKIKTQLTSAILPKLSSELATGNSHRQIPDQLDKIGLIELQRAIIILTEASTATTENVIKDRITKGLDLLAIRHFKQESVKDLNRSSLHFAQISLPGSAHGHLVPVPERNKDFAEYEAFLDVIIPDDLPSLTRIRALNYTSQSSHNCLLERLFLDIIDLDPSIQPNPPIRLELSFEKTDASILIRASLSAFITPVGKYTSRQIAKGEIIFEIPLNPSTYPTVKYKRSSYLTNPFGRESTYSALMGPAGKWIL